MSRLDARQKASGQARYTGDIVLDNMVWASVVRSPVPRGRIVGIDTTAARAVPGVVGIYTAQDLHATTYGRGVQDVPVLAGPEVRFEGERVAAVVAETRTAAEHAARLVEIDIDKLPAVTSMEQAVEPDAPLVHEAPWDYPNAKVRPEDGHNLQSRTRHGDLPSVEQALRSAAFVIDQTYRTPSGHHGYLEPYACVADYDPSGTLRLWLTNKSPYRVRTQVGSCLGIDPEKIDLQPVMLGGDFGGKGSPGDAPLCAALSRLCGRPVKLVLRYSEDLTAVNLRHPSRTRVRVGCDAEGRLVGAAIDMLMDGGAYAGYKPLVTASLHGAVEVTSYRIPAFAVECRIAYTNTVPKGHMRAPGSPQLTFAFESALDELALAAGIDPVELRRANLLRTGEADPDGEVWVEHKGRETLDAAVGALRKRPAPYPGWKVGWGVSVYSRTTPTDASTSMRLVPAEDGLRLEVGLVETGTGSHTAARELVGRALGFEPGQVEVAQVPTSALPREGGAGASRVTATLSLAADAAVKAWRDRLGDEPVLVDLQEPPGPKVGSYGVQIAQVAVDPETGALEVMEILTAADVATIVNHKAHQMQIDGGATMGFGFACLESSDESDGHVWAANLGEFKMASARDVPDLKTVLVHGARGIGTADVKSIGELTTPPTAAAIANAVADAVGCRVRQLPITAERIFDALHGGA